MTQRVDPTAIPDNRALDMVHTCVCSICSNCTMGDRLIQPDAREATYQHVVAGGVRVGCKASAIHRLIGTKGEAARG